MNPCAAGNHTALDLEPGQRVRYASSTMRRFSFGLVVSGVAIHAPTGEIKYHVRVDNPRNKKQPPREIPASWIRRGMGRNSGGKA